ncbi:MAG TPA: metallophosphoesterase [Polyangiaceae bacterium]|nr:metallophosphoesterase [Polyangiaceae bacterium]
MNLSTQKVIVLGVLAASVVGTTSFAGCSSDPSNQPVSENTGSVGLNLEVASGIQIDAVQYVLTGPGGFGRNGSINVSQSETLSATIDAIPLANGYSLTLNASALGGAGSCSGTASFDVTATGVTKVVVRLQCQRPQSKGTLLVNGAFNVCPAVDLLEANPAEVEVGSSLDLTGVGSDVDTAPSPLTYAWSASSGALSDPTASKTKFTCATPGPATITLSVSDGDTCPATRTVTVTCSEISTTPNLKVAFAGDMDSRTNYTQVLNLIKAEKADGFVVEGDMTYDAAPAEFWAATEAFLGDSFPVFISRGNHDDSTWADFLPKAAQHLDGAARIAGAHDANYKTIWRGLVIATIRKGDTGANITPFLQDEAHTWKICNWHQNQKQMQVGGKGDEMGWSVYEACRQGGAIIETGHEHSYERTKTLLDMTSQTVDPTCSDPNELCVGPGRTFTNVVGLGGNSIRPQLLCLPAIYPYGCKGEWAHIQTSNQGATHGAQFITFNAGNPKKATGYFKNVRGEVTDRFNVTYSAAH